jgi:hypothetical protein
VKFLSRGATAAVPAGVVVLQLALPGGTRFVGQVDANGCRARSAEAALPPHARVLLWDEHDLRFARAEPIGRREAQQLAAEANPVVAWLRVFSPDRTVAYARPLDELPADAEAAPLLLALELLDRPRGHGLLTVVLGEPAQPDLVMIIGRDADGALDGDRLQVWLRPQDDVAVLQRDYLERHPSALLHDGASVDAVDDAGDDIGAADDDGLRSGAPPAPCFTQHHLVEVARRMPVYPGAGEFFGRTPVQWAATAQPVLAAAAVATVAWALVSAWNWHAAGSRHDAALQRGAALRAELAALAAGAPDALARAAGLDARALVDAARAAWAPGARVRVTAGDEGASLTALHPLTVDVSAPASAAGAATPPYERPVHAAADAAAAHLARRLDRPAPPGYTRASVALSADHRSVAIRHVAAPPRPAAARLLDR